MSMTPSGPGSDHDRDGGLGPEGDGGPPRTNRADLPGLWLIIIGVLSLLWAAYQIFRGYQAKEAPVAEFDKQLEEAKKVLPAEWFSDPRLNGQYLKDQTVLGAFIGGGLGLVVAPLIILGGARMRALQSYGMAVTASVLALIPCLTCTGCCGLGQGIGIWALVVLLKPEVKALFR